MIFIFAYVCFCQHAKRLHDFNQSAWMALICLVLPPLGLVLLILPGSDGANKFGTQPALLRTGLPQALRPR
jgi:uncharacterized membrane protein YhaH (DUF805 family)